MLANFETREYAQKLRVWSGRYKHLTNIPHWHLESELILIEEGSATVLFDDEAVKAEAGDALYINGGDVHSISGDKDSLLAIIQFDPQLLPNDISSHKLVKPVFKAEKYNLYEKMHNIRKEIREMKEFYGKKTESLICELVIDLLRGEASTLRAETENNMITKYKKLLGEIDNNYAYYTFSDAAAFTGLSETYFSRWFHKMSGMTFSKYMTYIRVEKAVEMLHNKQEAKPVTAIATECGFDTIRHFNRVFKEITGTNPKHIPPDFVLNAQPVTVAAYGRDKAFDPTLKTSELLP
ncbi:MAG: helix-turn-helix domain-containing protein [Lachnospiraceae bacterium]|nr:helix-turn-helix domain-containing protein [Lachnospiraceae bacterium]